ncbi:MAG: DUF4091 domain-containing protein, partial [Armatimonadetes bacterium]|nr:DUF4091 domain-containing protein [Armatimonadota bacterium]
MRTGMILAGWVVCTLATAQGAKVWVASPWEHVLRNSPPGSARTVELFAAANEYEPFRIIVTAGTERLTDVTVDAGPLTGPARIGPERILLFREHYIDVTAPSYASTALTGWYPDPLIPCYEGAADAKYVGSPFDVEPGMNQGVWVDVYVPPNTPAGEYQGSVAVSAAGKLIGAVPVRLTVWNFALPDTIAMRSNFGGLGGGVAKAHGVDAGSGAFRQIEDRYIDTLLQHRCVPSSLGPIWPEWTPERGIDDTKTGERLRRMVEERHVNALALPFPYRDDPAKRKAYLHDLAAYLRQKGWLDLAYIYMEDEPNDAEQYETVRQQGALIHEADPGIKRLCTEQTITSDPAWGDLYGAVDIWCPLWGLYDEPTARQRQALGEEIWSYTALCQCAKTNPYWEIDFPPVSFRSPFWVSWHYRIKGFLYWSSVYWPPEHDPWTAPYFRDNYWGEGMLLYPGADAGIAGPVTSIRLKLIREAMEDFEYMTLAAKQGHGAQVDAIVDGL